MNILITVLVQLGAGVVGFVFVPAVFALWERIRCERHEDSLS